MSDYQNWLDKQNLAVQKASELIGEFRLDTTIIKQERKPNFVRINLGSNRLDFLVKTIKNRFVKYIWLCKKGEFDSRKNYLVYIEEDEKFLVSTGYQIDREAEYRDSDYHKNAKIVVVPIGAFRSARKFFKSIKKRYEEQLQKRMTQWT